MAKRTKPDEPTRAERDAARANRYKQIDEKLAVIRILTFHYASHLTPALKGYVDAWNWLVCVHLPSGPVCWRLSDAEREEHFKHLGEPVERHAWDRATQQDKRDRLAAIQGVSPSFQESSLD